MFYTKETFSSERKNRNSGRLVPILLALQISLMTLVAGSALATEPIDIDPDPDTPPPTTSLIIEEEEEMEIQRRLPPGRYVILVIGEDGSQRTYEIRI